MIFGLYPVIQRTLNQRGPAKSPSMKLVTFELSVRKKYFLKIKLSQSPYPSSKKPYIVCVWNGYLFSNHSQCRGVRRIGGNFHNRCGSYLGWTGRWTRPSLVKMDETSTMSSSIFSERWTRPSWLALRKCRFHEVFLVHIWMRFARTLGTFSSPTVASFVGRDIWTSYGLGWFVTPSVAPSSMWVVQWVGRPWTYIIG